ncbi:Pathogenesis-related protein PR-1 [Bienertia sinuspersici]
MSPITICFSLLLLLLLSIVTTSDASTTRTYSYRYNHIPYHPTQPTNDIYLYLKAHNAARAVVGVGPLSWDNCLVGYAQWWANQRRYGCALRHSHGPNGENIFWGSGNSWSPTFAVQSWIVEGKWYNYYTNSCAYGKECGHYTHCLEEF